MRNLIIDANVWIRFARFRNLTPHLNRLDIYGMTPVINNYLLSEIFDALVRKNWMNDKAAMTIIHYLETVCIVTAENVVYRLSPDPKDNYHFDLAILHNCAFIISYDTELLGLPFKPVPEKVVTGF